jgi:hypothetical protein
MARIRSASGSSRRVGFGFSFSIFSIAFILSQACLWVGGRWVCIDLERRYIPSSSDRYDVLYSDGGKFMHPVMVCVPVCNAYAAAREPFTISTDPSEQECGDTVDLMLTSLTWGGMFRGGGMWLYGM